MSILTQKTISKKITFEGIGIHTGREVCLSILPARPNTGIVFKRIDINQYYNGLEKARNILIQPQGGAERRPGLQFISTIPSTANPQDGVKLVPFEFSMEA